MNGNDVLVLLNDWAAYMFRARRQRDKEYRYQSMGDKRFIIPYERSSVRANLTATTITELLAAWNGTNAIC